jgi:hypothetical protein
MNTEERIRYFQIFAQEQRRMAEEQEATLVMMGFLNLSLGESAAHITPNRAELLRSGVSERPFTGIFITISRAYTQNQKSCFAKRS